MWITNGLQADWMCMLANTSDGGSYKNKSLICVPLNSKGKTTNCHFYDYLLNVYQYYLIISLCKSGITRTKIHKIGNDSSDTAQFFFEDVRVPAKNIIGDEGAGFFYQMLQFQQERLAGALGILKAMDSILSETIEYTKQRKAFGKSIIDNQVVGFRLAELATEVECLRALTYNAVGNTQFCYKSYFGIFRVFDQIRINYICVHI
jgi:citronellyl-CoA dehydrogenase